MKRLKAILIGGMFLVGGCVFSQNDMSHIYAEGDISTTVLAPEVTECIPVMESKILISWEDAGATTYEVQLSEDKTFQKDVKNYTFKGDKQSGVLDGLKGETTYYFKIRTCNVEPAGIFYSEWTIDPLKQRTNGHRYESKVKIQPTCTEEGEKVWTCQRCFEKKSESIPAKGHNYRWVQKKIGEEERRCKRCNDVKETRKIYPTSFAASTNTASVNVKGKAQLKVSSIFPENADPSIVYKSSNTKIATVSDKGVVTGKQSGTAKIQIASKCNPKLKKYITIKVVNRKPSAIAMKSKKMQLTLGKTGQLNVTVKPLGTYCVFAWSSSNSKVVSVSKTGLVKANKIGTATITVKTKNGKGKYISKTCKITVKKAVVSKPEQPKPEVVVPQGDRLYTIDLGDGKTENVVGHFDRNTETEIQNLVKDYRIEKGRLPAGTKSTRLQKISDVRAVEITKKFSHNRPNGKSYSDNSRRYPYVVGENLAKGYKNAESVVEAWKTDQATNSYMLAEEAQEIAISVFQKYCGVEDGKPVYESYYVLLCSLAVYETE